MTSSGRTARSRPNARAAEDLLLARRSIQVPKPDRPVLARRGEMAAVGAEGHAEDEASVAAKRLLHVPGPGVKDLQGPIRAGGGSLFAVGGSATP